MCVSQYQCVCVCVLDSRLICVIEGLQILLALCWCDRLGLNSGASVVAGLTGKIPLDLDLLNNMFIF